MVDMFIDNCLGPKLVADTLRRLLKRVSVTRDGRAGDCFLPFGAVCRGIGCCRCYAFKALFQFGSSTHARAAICMDAIEVLSNKKYPWVLGHNKRIY